MIQRVTPENASGLVVDYDEASENIVTLKDILKLYIYLEGREGWSNDPDEDPYEAVLDDDAAYMFHNPDHLPTPVRNFIRLQNEIAYRDTGERLHVISPALIESKYAIKGMRLKKLKSEQDKEDLIRRFLEDMERFFRHVFVVYAKAEAAEAYYQKVANYIETTIKVLDQQQERAFKPVIEDVREEMRATKKQILEHKKALVSKRLPNLTAVKEISTDLDEKTSRLKELSMNFKRVFSGFMRRFDYSHDYEMSPEPEATPRYKSEITPENSYEDEFQPTGLGMGMFGGSGGSGKKKKKFIFKSNTPPKSNGDYPKSHAASGATSGTSTSGGSAKPEDGTEEKKKPPEDTPKPEPSKS